MTAVVSVTKTAIPGHTVLNVAVRWSTADPGSGSGVSAQLFQWRTDDGSWVTVHLPSTSTRTVKLRLPPGHTFTFRVRATDRAGNVGSFGVRSIRI
jgi:hypothetical protein